MIYVNDLPQALKKCSVRLYADDTCIFYTHNEVKQIESTLNEDFSNLCEWFVKNKLSIHLGEDKTKCILFTKRSTNEELNISFGSVTIKQHRVIEYLGCILNDNLTGENMILKVLNKINSKLKFLYRQSEHLNPQLRRMLCNALLQPHFDYACTSWYPLVKTCYKQKYNI